MAVLLVCSNLISSKLQLKQHTAQKLWDLSIYYFLFNALKPNVFCVIGRTGSRKEVGILRLGSRGPDRVLRHQVIT